MLKLTIACRCSLLYVDNIQLFPYFLVILIHIDEIPNYKLIGASFDNCKAI